MSIASPENAMFARFQSEVISSFQFPYKIGNNVYLKSDGSPLERLPNTDDGAFLAVTTNPAESTKTELGATGRVEHTGDLVVQVNVPIDSGDALLSSILDGVREAFQSKIDSGIRYLTPSISDRITGNGWTQRTVRCPYRYFS